MPIFFSSLEQIVSIVITSAFFVVLLVGVLFVTGFVVLAAADLAVVFLSASDFFATDLAVVFVAGFLSTAFAFIAAGLALGAVVFLAAGADFVSVLTSIAGVSFTSDLFSACEEVTTDFLSSVFFWSFIM